jgi:hypothetical protein
MESVFLVVFNILFFMWGGWEQGPAAWISYVFIHLAYATLLVTPMLVRGGKSAPIFGASLFGIASVYFAVEFVVGLVFIIALPHSFVPALSIQLIMAGLYVVIAILSMIANERTAQAESSHQHDLEFVKRSTLQAKRIVDSASEASMRKTVEQVYDTVRTSPVKSHPQVSEFELSILGSLGQLESAVSMNDHEKTQVLARSLLGAINERNNWLKGNN